MSYTPGPWTVKESDRFPTLYISGNGQRIAMTYGEGDFYRTQIPNARLISVAPEMIELLREIEWTEPCDCCSDERGKFCPSCGAWEEYGHLSSCKLAGIIRKVEGDE